jgi:hypothetical protein
MSSAQLDPLREYPQEDAPEPFALEGQVDLKEQVAARLAAHRARRQRTSPATPAPIPITSPARARAARIAATVAERYAHSESYRSFLAAQAETAIREAEAAAEVAAFNARAVAEAQLDLLEELDNYSQTHSAPHETGHPESVQTEADKPQAKPPVARQQADSSKPTAQSPAPTAPLYTRDLLTPPSITAAPSPEHPTPAATHAPRVTVRLYEDVAPAVPPSITTSHLYPTLDPLDEEGLALDEEIAFRQSPTFEPSTPPTEIPANLIEFPRQLVAARRARPRLAEGPLREEAELAHEPSQLRIFEVEQTQISTAPASVAAAPEWSSIMLGAHPVFESDASGPAYMTPLMVEAEEPATIKAVALNDAILFTAPLEFRIMSAAVDSCIVLSAMLAAAAAAALTVGSLPALEPLTTRAALTQLIPMALAAGVTFLIFTALYQLLFFSFSESTPGMKYARIGLCTFSDENPTRAQLRRRVLHTLLAACPLGLGLLWSWIDTERLGWHDRLSRTYQRSY